MKIIFTINEDKSIKLSLFEGKGEKDSLEWKDENSLSRVLLVNLDKLLHKNRLGLDKISGYTIISEVPQKWTTYRIADITSKTLKIGLSSSSAGKLAK
ncbi:MAG: hypothetical protein V1814_03430 [Candidatus Moraniibacteriota bacterium]